jgi:hypothetical protein
MLRYRPHAASSPPTLSLARHPIELGDLFILYKNRRAATAVIFTHQLGWEVRLTVGASGGRADAGVQDAGGGVRLRGAMEGVDEGEGVAMTARNQK